MPRATHSSRKPRFEVPKNFSFLSDSNRWYCNICPNSNVDIAQRQLLSSGAALKHEKSHSHRTHERCIAAWDVPPGADPWQANHEAEAYFDLQAARVQDKWDHVDSLKDLIPFWIRQVAAAERGEELRYEAFLDDLYEEKLKTDPWNTTTWDVRAPAWAADDTVDGNDWGKLPRWAVTAEDDDGITEPSRLDLGELRENGCEDASGIDRDAFKFVEKVAQMRSISGSRKQHLHAFYKTSTDEKVSKIRDLISSLQVLEGH